MRYLADGWWGNHMAWVHCHEESKRIHTPGAVEQVCEGAGSTRGTVVVSSLQGARFERSTQLTCTDGKDFRFHA